MTASQPQCSVQRGIACLPVTALHILELNDVTLLFSNEGSSLVVRHATNDHFIFRHPIFSSQNIHGILTAKHRTNESDVEYHLVVWGGRMVYTGLLAIQSTTLQCQVPSLRLGILQVMAIDDWIMAIAIHPTNTSAIILTAHNALWQLGLCSEAKTLVSLGFGMKTLLCSGSMTALTNDQILVASGTVFGEVIVWVCSRSQSLEYWSSSTRHMFLGHQGSIFGVAISDLLEHENRHYRLVASCSDDRTIRLWDVSNCEEDGPTLGHQAAPLYTTGFGTQHGQTLHLSMTWAHLSRIWGVHFLSACEDNKDVVSLVSRGEDGMCQLWGLSLDELLRRPVENVEISILKAVGRDRHHSGKNVWCLVAAKMLSETIIYTGGADGRLVSRLLRSRQTAIHISVPFRGITDTQGQFLSKGLRQYLVLDDGTVIATTNDGSVIRSCDDSFDRWLPFHHPIRRSTTILCSNHACGFTFYCSSDGDVFIYDIINRQSQRIECILSSQATWIQIIHVSNTTDQCIIRLLVNLHSNSPPKLITLSRKDLANKTQIQDICLPSGFMINSGFWYDNQHTLICGSRTGFIAIFPNILSESIQLNHGTIIRHVHGYDAITSFTALPASMDSQSLTSIYILTTGRDGTFAVHLMCCTGTAVKFETLHRGTPPFGPYIEGATILNSDAQESALILHGFRSTTFVTWDENHQTELMSVECGGAHRHWSYCAGQQNGGTFAWTRAGMFGYSREYEPSHQIVQHGGHGREIKALAVSSCDGSNGIASKFVATGAEDTEIRLFKRIDKSIMQVAALKHHTTGLQALKFSGCGQYLFSSGGVEEFVVWKLSDIPILGIGAVVVGSLIKNQADDDARIMGFDVMNDISTEFETQSFTILMSYSNGKSKLFEFDVGKPSSTGTFRLLEQFNIGNLCLTQAQIIKDRTSYSVLVGATDGVLRYTNVNGSSDEIITHRVHQSNIAAMSAKSIAPGTYAIATGGDDNALAISLLQTHNDRAIFETAIVPKAHAAAVTAVTIAPTGSLTTVNSLYVVSTGNDQKVRLWRISRFPAGGRASNATQGVSGTDKWSESAHIEKLCDYSIDVADVSNLETLTYKETRHGVFELEVLVVGVGMQSISFKVG